MTHVEVNLQNGGRGSIKVDGVDLSMAVRGVDVASRVGKDTLVTLHLIPTSSVTGEWDATFGLPDAVRVALIQMGWTPPQEKPITTSAPS